MSSPYTRNDFTVNQFTTRDSGNEYPTTAVESLACAVLGPTSAARTFARFVEENTCGVTPEGLCEAVHTEAASWSLLCPSTRQAEHEHCATAELFAVHDALCCQTLPNGVKRPPCFA